jgi:hypothetical protein
MAQQVLPGNGGSRWRLIVEFAVCHTFGRACDVRASIVP